jgi:hypothetical protein
MLSMSTHFSKTPPSSKNTSAPRHSRFTNRQAVTPVTQVTPENTGNSPLTVATVDLSLAPFVIATADLSSSQTENTQVEVTSEPGTNSPRTTPPEYEQLHAEIRRNAEPTLAPLSEQTPPTPPETANERNVEATSSRQRTSKFVIGQKVKTLTTPLTLTTSSADDQPASEVFSPRKEEFASPLSPLGGSLGSDTVAKKEEKKKEHGLRLKSFTKLKMHVKTGKSGSESPKTPSPTDSERKVSPNSKKPLALAAQSFLANVFKSITALEKSRLLLEVIKQAKEAGSKDWVMKAVKALKTTPEILADVCKQHVDLVVPYFPSPLTDAEKKDLETLLFAVQTHLRKNATTKQHGKLLSQIKSDAKAQHGKRFLPKFQSTFADLKTGLTAYMKDLGASPMLRNDTDFTRQLWCFWDTNESDGSLRNELVDQFVTAAKTVADQIEGFPLSDNKIQHDLLTKEQLAIVLEAIEPLFTKLFSAETVSQLSPDSIKLIKLIDDTSTQNNKNVSGANVFFLRFIAPTFSNVFTAAGLDPQGLLLKEINFMKFCYSLLQKFVAQPSNAEETIDVAENLGFTPLIDPLTKKPAIDPLTQEPVPHPCHQMLSKWLSNFSLESFTYAISKPAVQPNTQV